uniref:Uncharacterized protein n=1 Tax=Lepeophtheirus salmonis TaxID=72036 RepID=A0A0K2VL47_LEPSM
MLKSLQMRVYISSRFER